MQSEQGDRGQSSEPTGAAEPASFAVGDRVTLQQSLPYLKTADPMPMLRPPDLVSLGEVGAVSEIRPRDQLAVRFRRGTFLLSVRDLRPVTGSD
jgi:hypothetical protein